MKRFASCEANSEIDYERAWHSSAARASRVAPYWRLSLGLLAAEGAP
jgi:hypothetical protein